MEIQPSDLSPDKKELMFYTRLGRIPIEKMRQLMMILVGFNKRVKDYMSLFDLNLESLDNINELQRVLIGSRDLMFMKFKRNLMQEIL